MTLLDQWAPEGRSAPVGTGRLLVPDALADPAAHVAYYGPLPDATGSAVASVVTAAGIVGRGGGAYPTGRKLTAVHEAGRKRPPVVIVNASEGDPTSLKDAVLITRTPHLVLDGAVLAARAVGARRILLAAHTGGPLERALRAAVRARADAGRFEFLTVPARFVASEASSLVNLAETGDARPRGRVTPVWQSGVGRAPTLVDNAETLAQVALAVRHGAGWFRSVGSSAEPGTGLVTLRGAVRSPGVIEVVSGATVGEILASVDAPRSGIALFGGLGGRWARIDDLLDVPYTVADLAAAGASRGVGSIVILPPDGCVLIETARIAHHLAEESAGQCGPCMFGLPAIAGDLAALAAGDASARDRLRTRLPVISGRGGCGHPDGAVAMAGSALGLLEHSDVAHLRRHLDGRGCRVAPVVPLTGRGR